MSDPVNHPAHYTSHPSGVECIEITRRLNFTLGNCVKYAWRHELKNGDEDLRKAQWYYRAWMDDTNDGSVDTPENYYELRTLCWRVIKSSAPSALLTQVLLAVVTWDFKFLSTHFDDLIDGVDKGHKYEINNTVDSVVGVG